MSSRRIHTVSRIAVSAAALLAASQAYAHGATPGTHAFLSGLLHPLTALEHILPLVAIGMLAGQRGLVAGQGLLVAFPLAFAAGALLGVAAGPELPAVNAVTAIVAGGLVALALGLPRALLYAIVVAVGAIHGLSNGTAIGQALTPFIAGATLASTLVFAYAFGATHYALKWTTTTWMPVVVRAMGSWIAAFGILTLALAFMPSPLPPGATALLALIV